jgi:uncharacterized iron-regulated protein
MVAIRTGTLWLGEHHNSAKDDQLQAILLRRISQQRKRQGKHTAVGLEQVQLQFQPVLDRYIAGDITLDQLRNQVEWDIRWQWPFATYEPIFQTARNLDIPLVALNVDSEDLALVEKGGLPGLPKDVLFKYVSDP